jgi:hypothetical protein
MNERTYEDRLPARMVDAIDVLPVPAGRGGLVPSRVVRSFGTVATAVLVIAGALVLLATPVTRSAIEGMIKGAAPGSRPSVEPTAAPTPGSVVPIPFGPGILDRVVLTSSDVSPSLRVRSDLAGSGFTVLGRLVSGPEGVALVNDPNFVDARSRPFEGDDPYVFFGSWSALYVDRSSAHAAFQGFVRMFASPEWFAAIAPQDPVLGDEGVVFAVKQGQSGVQAALTGGREPRTMYLWRTGNLLMRFDAQGSFDPAEARRLAEAMQARAK